MSERARTISPEEVDLPPEPPQIARRLRLSLTHGIGAAMLTIIVLLAALGAFGESRSATSARSASLELVLEHPTRFRYKQIEPLRIFVTNRSDREIDTVTVSFDTAYVARFSSVTFTPAPSAAWEVKLTGVRAAETRRIDVELQAEEYGTHSGVISAFFAGSDTARVEVDTFIFP
jgi:hypothetical protein